MGLAGSGSAKQPSAIWALLVVNDVIAPPPPRALILPAKPMRATESPADILDSMLRSPTERNAVNVPGSASAVEVWQEMRAKVLLFADPC
jgi:hypothetical protein